MVTVVLISASTEWRAERVLVEIPQSTHSALSLGRKRS